jgi:hypothetical protein
MRLLCACLIATSLVARADAEPTVVEVQPTVQHISPARRALAIAAAIVPGILVRGAGSWVAGEKRAAKRLAIAGYGSLGVAAIGGAFIGPTGGSPQTAPMIPLVVLGFGGFVTTWVADVFTAAGGGCVCGRALAVAPWTLEVGETWQHDAYRGRVHARIAGRIELGRVDLGGAALLHVGGDAWLGFADARVRILGEPATGRVIADGSRLLARVGGRVQRDDVDRVTQVVGEVEVIGRYDLRRLDPALRATFLEGSTGVGGNHIKYAGTASELDSVLLATFAWGMYLPTGELALYYDHRRDGLAGGIAAWRAAAYVGSIGAAIDVGIAGPWALRGNLQFGNAWLTTLALSYRGGPR